MQNDVKVYGADVHGVRQMIIYGLKGLSSYARHAELLGQWDQTVGEFVHEVSYWDSGTRQSESSFMR